jgi:inorganic triphosphatase YgiF
LAEIELKLSVVPDRLSELKQALESMGLRSATTTSSLSSTYYDSQDLKLRQHDLNFRVREVDGRYLQTLKANDFTDGNVLTRSEWEDAIASDRPDLAAPNTGSHLHGVVVLDELRPWFKTIVQRTVVELEPRSATRIEVAIDEGEIHSLDGSGTEPLCEIELELKSGEPAAIYDIAMRLLDVAPLRIETRSKSERGYALVAPDDGTPTAIRAKRVVLHRSMTVETVLQGIGRSCITHLLCNQPAVLAGQPEGIHQMRVAARRLRAALSALKPMIPAEHYQWARDELKWLAAMLGPARNWEVFVANLLQPVEQALPAEADLKRLTAAADQRRRAAYERAREAIGSPRYIAAILKLARWIEARGWRDQPASEQAAMLFATIGDIAPGLIERRWRRARKRSRQFSKLSQEQRHKLRIALKKMRYTIEFLETIFDDDEVKALGKRLKPLQEDLGHSNDVRTAHQLVEELSRHVNEGGNDISRAGGIVLGWHNRGLTDNEPRVRKDVRRLRRAKPFWQRVDLSTGAPVGSLPTSGL